MAFGPNADPVGKSCLIHNVVVKRLEEQNEIRGLL